MTGKDRRLEEFGRLLDLLDRLRTSCPWDMKQTNESLRKLTIEEAFELADAIIEGDDNEICNELGDLMLHLAFYARIGREKGKFDMTEVLERINRKLIYRHPHVFGDINVTGAAEVEQNWEKLKMNENHTYKNVLSGVPSALPALIKANRIQEKASGAGFDWDVREQVWDKVSEEISELKTEIGKSDRECLESEFGDVFFSLVNAARLYEVDPEAALEKTNRKFIKRFNFLEKKTLEKGRSLHDMTLDEMNEIWERAKEEE